MDQNIDTAGQDRSRRARLAVIGSAAAIFFPGTLVFGFPGLMGPIWREMLGLRSGALGYVMFFMLASLGLFMFFVGKWTVTLGAKKLIRIGTLLSSLAALLIAFVSNLGMIYLWAFLVGAASCFIYSPGINSVQRWYPRQRGLMSGIVNLSFGISAAIMVPLIRLLLETLGYQTLCVLFAGLTLVVGLTAAGFTEIPEKVRGLAPAEPVAAGSVVPGQPSLTPTEVIRTRSFWYLWVVWALMGGAGVTMVTQSVSFGLSRGFDLAAAAVILSVYNLANGSSRIISGAISDRIGRNLTLSIAFLGAALGYLLLPQASGLLFISVLAGLVGFGYGTLFACSSPMIADCFGLQHFGAILGLVFTSYGFIAGLIGPALSAHLLTVTNGNYGLVFSYLATLCIISAFLIMRVKAPGQPEAAGRGAAAR